MTRTTITPQLLVDLLETHAIAGEGSVVDCSLDADNSDVAIRGGFDIEMVARELNAIDQPSFDATPISRPMAKGLTIAALLAAAVAVALS